MKTEGGAFYVYRCSLFDAKTHWGHCGIMKSQVKDEDDKAKASLSLHYVLSDSSSVIMFHFGYMKMLSKLYNMSSILVVLTIYFVEVARALLP